MIISGDINQSSTNERMAITKMQIWFHLLHIETCGTRSYLEISDFAPTSILPLSVMSSMDDTLLSINSNFRNITCKALYCFFDYK